MCTKFIVFWIVVNTVLVTQGIKTDQYGRYLESDKMTTQKQTVEQTRFQVFASQKQAVAFVQDYEKAKDMYNTDDECKNFRIIPFEADSAWSDQRVVQEYMKSLKAPKPKAKNEKADK